MVRYLADATTNGDNLRTWLTFAVTVLAALSTIAASFAAMYSRRIHKEVKNGFKKPPWSRSS